MTTPIDGSERGSSTGSQLVAHELRRKDGCPGAASASRSVWERMRLDEPVDLERPNGRGRIHAARLRGAASLPNVSAREPFEYDPEVHRERSLIPYTNGLARIRPAKVAS